MRAACAGQMLPKCSSQLFSREFTVEITYEARHAPHDDQRGETDQNELELTKEGHATREVGSQEAVTEVGDMAEEGIGIAARQKQKEEQRHSQCHEIARLHREDLACEWMHGEMGEFLEGFFTSLPVHLQRTLGRRIEDLRPRWAGGTAQLVARMLAKHIDDFVGRDIAMPQPR